MPRIDDLFNQLQGATVFSKINLRDRYHQLSIKEGNVSKMAFWTRCSHYTLTVLPFGLANSPTTFMDLINRVCRPFLDLLVMVFIDDILIYFQNTEGHGDHLSIVLRTLQDH